MAPTKSEPREEYEIAGVVLPANVMLPNGSSTLSVGNHMSYTEGSGPQHTRVGGQVSRITFQPGNACVRVEITDREGPYSGEAFVTSSGMVCYVRKPQGEEKKA